MAERRKLVLKHIIIHTYCFSTAIFSVTLCPLSLPKRNENNIFPRIGIEPMTDTFFSQILSIPLSYSIIKVHNKKTMNKAPNVNSTIKCKSSLVKSGNINRKPSHNVI